MAMPASCIGLLTCVNGACSSISAAACGTTTGPKCLTALATAAGKAKCMSAFFGYNDNLVVTPASFLTVPAAGCTAVVTACAPAFNTYAASCGVNGWLHPTPTGVPSPAGTTANIIIDPNSGVARFGCACYTPMVGTMQSVLICQVAGITYKCVYVGGVSGSGCGGTLNSTYQYGCLKGTVYSTPLMVNGECYCICIAMGLSASSGCAVGFVYCNATLKLCCCTAAMCASPTISFPVIYSDCVCLCVTAYQTSYLCSGCSCAKVYVQSVTSISGGEMLSGCACVNTYTG